MIENDELYARLVEAEETLNAIRTGSVDALVVSGPHGDQVYTLEGADRTYRLLVEEMSEGAVVLTTDGSILYCNKCFAEMLGMSLESCIGGSLGEFVSPEEREAMRALLGQGLESRSTDEFSLNTADGQRIPVHLSATGLELGDAEAICLIVTDLTEQKRNQTIMTASMKQLEEEQHKANKLESLGILAGGLAHDLNNSLTAVLANVSLARRSISTDADTLRRLSEAEMACLRARDVTEQLLTFAKGGMPIKETASIAHELKSWAGFALSGSSVNCEFELAPDLRAVELDKSQLGRVVQNLLINAQQAMPEGGRIIIRAMNVDLGPGNESAGVPLPDGAYVRIDIRDTGTGIPESHIARIFDPYFTTKQEGSGLGLSIAYSVVKNHDGYISVESEPGAGATFRIFLPASCNVPDVSTRLHEPSYPGRLRVLLLDDQESIREVIRDIVVNLVDGEVEFADDGAKAVELYREASEAGNPFDVVLMDLTIPGGMGGREAIKELLELDPNAKAIVVSGYSNDPIMSRYRDYGFKAVITKPFEVDEFLETLNAVTSSSE